MLRSQWPAAHHTRISRLPMRAMWLILSVCLRVTAERHPFIQPVCVWSARATPVAVVANIYDIIMIYDTAGWCKIKTGTTTGQRESGICQIDRVK